MTQARAISRRCLLAAGAASAGAAALSPWRAAAQSRGEGFDGAKTRALVIGILSWQDPRFRGFPTEGRRDATLVSTLRRKGVPESNIVFLRDRDATRAAIEQAFTRAVAATAADETLLVYYAGHGSRAEDGKAFFVPWDAVSGSVPRTGVSMEAMVDAVTAASFRGRAVFAADCCYSGSLTREAQRRSSGRPVATLTSSMASVVSTGNWTFTECLLAGLDGAAVADTDRDGTVTLEDLGRFTDAQMAFAEEQLATWTAQNGFSPRWSLSAARPRACAREGERIEVLYRGQWYRAQIEGERQGAVRVHYIGYTRDWDEWVTPDRCRAFAPQRFPQGGAVEVEWNGTWYPARILAERAGIHQIHYDGYTDVWDEWVASRRCRARTASESSGGGGTATRSAPSSRGGGRGRARSRR
jgi:hypothetical protein